MNRAARILQQVSGIVARWEDGHQDAETVCKKLSDLLIAENIPQPARYPDLGEPRWPEREIEAQDRADDRDD